MGWPGRITVSWVEHNLDHSFQFLEAVFDENGIWPGIYVSALKQSRHISRSNRSCSTWDQDGRWTSNYVCLDFIADI